MLRIALADAYALIALAFGLFFIAATPPFGMADETAHFERAYETAIGAYTGAEGVPSGMQELMDDAFGLVKSGGTVDGDDYRRWAAIDLRAEEITPWPEPLRAVMRLHSPLCYVHFAPIVKAGVALEAPPLSILYAGRLAALLVGVLLVRAAIGVAPAAFGPALACIALLPTTIVFFGAFNIESLVVGLGFYFFALVARHAVEPNVRLKPADILQLAAIAFLLGQFKSAYLFLPAFALVLPSSKFAGWKAQAIALALIIVPGAIASLGWAVVVKDMMLGDVSYSTMNGNHVEPSAQLAGVLADPLGYAAIVLRTLFASDSPSMAWLSMLALGGWTNIKLPVAFYALLSAGLILVWSSGERPPRIFTRPLAVTLQLAIVGATALAILTLVYFQWNGVGDAVITGFQGRYLLAATPLLLAAAPVRLSILEKPARRTAVAFGAPLIGLFAMGSAVLGHYWQPGAGTQREASNASASRIASIAASLPESADQSSFSAIADQIASTSSISIVHGSPAK